MNKVQGSEVNQTAGLWQRIDWPVTLFLTILPLVTLIALPLLLIFWDFHLSIFIFSLLFAVATSMSITAGYHRLFAHRSYEAHPVLRWLYILFGTSAWQGSALQWCAGHRRHHMHEDTDMDPYTITKGFWYAHFGWMLLKMSHQEKNYPADLEKDWLLRFQHKHYITLAIFTGFWVPTMVGHLMGDAVSGLVWGGFVRVVFTQHCTYFVNSLCHYLGRQTYSDKITARDSAFVAVLTYGEGYHNFHHSFQADYRNGIRWYHWDPTKWAIRFFSWIGLARKLRRISQQEILKARLQMEELKLKSKGFSQEHLESLKAKILTAQIRTRKLKEEYALLKKNWSEQSTRKLAEIRKEIEVAKLDFDHSLRVWKTYLRSPLPLT